MMLIPEVTSTPWATKGRITPETADFCTIPTIPGDSDYDYEDHIDIEEGDVGRN